MHMRMRIACTAAFNNTNRAMCTCTHVPLQLFIKSMIESPRGMTGLANGSAPARQTRNHQRAIKGSGKPGTGRAQSATD